MNYGAGWDSLTSGLQGMLDFFGLLMVALTVGDTGLFCAHSSEFIFC